MGANTRIEWADHTFNPWFGCTRVSRGCEHCYAETMMAKRYGRVKWGPAGDRIRTGKAVWRQPIAWDKAAARAGKKARVFCASLADVFDNHPSIMRAWRADLFHLIAETPHLEWLLLTKRPQNWYEYFVLRGAPRGARLGVTIEDQSKFLQRGGYLATASLAGEKTFVSYEPALGPVDWRPLLKDGAIGWMIAGGESGHGARPAHPDWFRTTRDQCAEYGVPFFFKQWGEWGPAIEYPAADAHRWPIGPGQARDGIWSYRVGKKNAGRLLDGIEHNAFPEGQS